MGAPFQGLEILFSKGLSANILPEASAGKPYGRDHVHAAAGVPHGGISDIPGVLAKPGESARGVPLAWLRVKVTDN
jgi:hypothetical protein